MNPIERARRLTRLMLISGIALMWVVVAFHTLAVFGEGRLRWWSAGPALIATAWLTALCPGMIDAILDRRHPTKRVVLTAVLTVVAMVTGGGEPLGYGFVLVTWLTIATLGVSRRASVLMSLGSFVVGVGLGALSIVTGTSLVALDMDVPQAMIFYVLLYGFWSLVLPPSMRIWFWVWNVAVEAHEGREAHTRLALAEERLRFARDLHDLVGHQLSAIAVKTELATRLSDVDAKAAKAEMAEVNALTRQALKELRQAVRGYRELDLAAELNSVKGVLEAAGVRCEVRLPYRELPAGVAPVFAYAVREAVTNVLKHSTATFCEITLRFTEQEAELTVRNDGVARAQAEDLGTGLAGMAERLVALGGAMTARPTGDGEFLLRAVVSLPLDG